MIETIAAAIGILVGITAVLGTLSKLQLLHSRLESRDQELKGQISQLQLSLEHTTDRVELLVNGLRERVEHINTRLSNQHKDINATITDIESFLQKRTEYERRSR